MSDIVKMLEGVDHGSVEDCFLQSPLFAKAAAEIVRLRSDLEKAREALRPFAAFIHVINVSDATWGNPPLPDDKSVFGSLTVGYFRRAAATLKEIDNERT